MKKFYVILEEIHEDKLGREFPVPYLRIPHPGNAQKHPTESAARAEATKQAALKGVPFYVAEILGAQTPVYDPSIGWEPVDD